MKNPSGGGKGEFASPFGNTQFLFIFSLAFLVYLSSSMLNQTLPKYAKDLGAAAQAVGLLAGTFQIAALFMRPISGQVVDNENRLHMLRIVLFVILISVIGLVTFHQYWLLVLFRAIHGLAWGVGSTLFMTIASGCFTRERMTTGIGIYGLGQVIAQTIAPMFALPVAHKYGYSTLYIGNVALILLCLAITVFMKVESPAPKKRAYSYNIRKMVYLPALLPASLTAANSIAKSSIQAFLIIFAGTMNIVNIGIYFTVQAVAVFVMRPLLSKLADRFGHTRILIPCEISIVAGLVTIALARNLPTFLIASVFMGIGTAGEQPILMSECVKSAPPEKRGNASNTSYVGVDAGGFIGSNVAGFAVAFAGYRQMYLLFIIPVIAATATYILIARKKQKLSEAASSADAVIVLSPEETTDE